MAKQNNYRSIHLAKRNANGFRIDLRNVNPQAVAGKSSDDIGGLEVYSGNRTLKLKEIFDIEVRVEVNQDAELSCNDSPCDELLLTGDLSRVDFVGYRMNSGRMVIESDVGHCAGSNMIGGEIFVNGNAADRAGVEMSGGRLSIVGDAADHLGAALPGSRKGMRGGLITVAGSVGNGAGESMRRGMIAIAGNAGQLTAWRMCAGTIVVGGCSGTDTACGMIRGTVIAGEVSEDFGPMFLPGIVTSPGSFSLIRRYLQRNDLDRNRFTALESLFEAGGFQSYFGDHTAGGRGELFVACS